MTDRQIDVLIIEDDRRIAEINRRFTEKIEGFHVVALAESGEEARDWIEVYRPQLVLLDVYLPDSTGVELVREIRSKYWDVDIIMITAAKEIEVIQDALRGGVRDYIVKPLVFDRFKQSLEKYRNDLYLMTKAEKMEQSQIDTLWFRGQNRSVESGGREEFLTKGIDGLTLEKVMNEMVGMGDGVTSEMVSQQVGISRSTARRYLEYLVSIDRLRADLVYGTVGRPERRYYRMS
ncbi:response regulator [Aneurinibacillus sp. REN35]|uniref:response regulator n=1 Tax=Aneurinibacillus sp. REN35 TaxID=3237286 RepID=UPI00352711E4